jgi:peptide deformylase
LEIILYPHPTLRHKSKIVRRVDRELKSIVQQMFALMYQAKGIGLAANQIDLPLQIFVINTAGEEGNGEELVFINPVIEHPKGSDDAEEGCLSIPGVLANVTRPSQIKINAYDLAGNELNLTVDGLLARAIQHEHDHLQGTLFIDRVSAATRKQLQLELDSFETDFESKRRSNQIPSDDKILKRLTEIEKKYC